MKRWAAVAVGEEAAKVVFSCGVSMPPAARALWGRGMF